jgi:hypothetical protein
VITQVSLWCLFLTVSAASAAQTTPPSSTQLEITSLLESVGASGCDFYRNGTWYDAKQAQRHLQMKYSGLAGGHRIATAEEFIARVATRSSLSGQPYRIRCSDSGESYTELWLLERLARYRARGAAGISQAAPRTNPTGSS